ncbi:MAG: type I-E CRISPR-associated protein Cse1/CasA [Pyrinomonadaceae bacterium]
MKRKTMAEFNLITEEWIPCVMCGDSSGEIKPKSLREAFAEADQIEEIIGENPLVTISLYRLLIAILHDCLQGPKDYDEWGKWWSDETFDTQKLNEYFSQNEKNFHLFDDEKPFYQTSKVEFDEKFLKPIWKFFLEGEHYTTLFEHTNTGKSHTLTAAQTARYLLAFQNFDVGGLQTYVHEKGMTQVEISNVKSADASLLNKCAVALVKGENLFKTLMLNLTQYDCKFGIPFPKREIADSPVWRNDREINPKEDSKPVGYVDLLTWQSRRIRLKQKTELSKAVVGEVVVMKGNQISELSSLYGKEQMACFRKSPTKGWTSISFQREKFLWRDSLSLFQSVEEKSARPQILDWLNDLISNGKLPSDAIFPLEFFGLCVNKAKPLFWRHERLPLPVIYLNNQKLCDELGEALKLAEIIAGLLSGGVYRMATLHFLPDTRFEIADWFRPALSRDLRQKAKDSFDKLKKSKDYKKKFNDVDDLSKSLAPELRYWSRLETPFRHLLLALAVNLDDWKNERQKWAKVLQKTALLAFDEVAFSLGNSPRSLRSTSVARNWLEVELRIKRKRYANFEAIDDEVEKQEEEEVEE